MKRCIRISTIVFSLTVAALAGCGIIFGGPNADTQGPGPSGPENRGDRPKLPALNPQELSEYQVIGISIFRKIEESDIERRLREPHKFALNPQSCILLAQSGADTPDAALSTALAKRFRVSTMSGVPDRDSFVTYDDDEDFRGMTSPRGKQMINSVRLDKAFRLAAAKAGADTIVVVWKKSAGKGIPGVRAAVIDVETGKWEIISPLADEKVEAVGDDNKPKHDKKPKVYPDLNPEELVAGYETLAATLETEARANAGK
jgi:hypothetical protein